jgi:alpha-N-arabinofuranosidase
VWLGFDGIDPSLFFDNNGRAYFINNGAPPDNKPLYDGHRAIWIQEFDIAAQKLVGPRSIIVNGGVDLAAKPVWIEGPHLYRRGDWYYLCCAEGGTGDDHSQVIFRSKSVTGPFVPWDRNPILTQRDLDGTQPQAVTATGHADLVIGPDGNWWSVFLACRPYGGRYYNTGRETFLLPVKWTDDGWPVILPPGERVPYVVPAPVGPALVAGPIKKPNTQVILQEGTEATEKTSKTDSKSSVLSVTCENNSGFLTGNFTWRDAFDGPALSPLWIMLRQPHETWWSLTANPGHLSLTPRRETLSGQGNPSFLARRLQHARFEATTALAPPAMPGVSAGLVAFQNETHHYFFGVRRAAAGCEVFVERLNGKRPEIVATVTIPETARIELRLTGEKKVLAFAYATDAGQWQTLVADADATVLSTQAAGGFVGAVLGLHARLEP